MREQFVKVFENNLFCLDVELSQNPSDHHGRLLSPHCVATMVICSTVPPAAPTPGPEVLTIRLLSLIAKTPAWLEFPMLIVPVNAWPLLQVGTFVATVAPFGVVFGIEGFGEFERQAQHGRRRDRRRGDGRLPGGGEQHVDIIVGCFPGAPRKAEAIP